MSSATEDAAGIDVDGVVEPERLGHRRVSVDDESLAAIVRRPVVADRQAELIRLAGGLAVEGELANRARAATLHLLLQAGVGDDQLPVVEDDSG